MIRIIKNITIIGFSITIQVNANNPDSLLHVSQKALPIQKAQIYCKLGEHYAYDEGQLDKSLKFYNEALVIYQKENNNKGQIDCYFNISEVYVQKGEYSAALESVQKSLDIAVKSNETCLERQYNQFGYVYSEWGHYDKSIEYYTKSLEIARKVKNKATEAAVLNNIGYVHKLWKNYDLALNFYYQTLAIDSSLNDVSLVACDMNNIAFMLRHLGKIREAIVMYNEAITLCEKMNYKYEKALAYNGLGSLYLDLKQNKKALYYLKKGINLFIISQNENYLPSAYHNIGNAYKEINKPDSALAYFFKSLDLARRMGIQDEILDALKSISETYSVLKEYDKAYKYQQLYNSVNDSVFNIKKHKQLAEFQGKYDLDKKNKQITKLASEQQKNRAMIKFQWLLVALSIIFLIVMIFYAFRWYEKYKQNQKVAEFLAQQKEDIEMRLKSLERSISAQTTRYSGSNLSEKDLVSIMSRLQAFLDETRLYLENDLSLPYLAEKIDISVHHLSQAINIKTNLNFNDYINSFRVKEAKTRLVSSDFNRFTIEAVGRSVGFNNKTTFIAAFKKFENQMPSEYKKKFTLVIV